jgi:hypothetical protein
MTGIDEFIRIVTNSVEKVAVGLVAGRANLQLESLILAQNERWRRA